MKKIISIVLLSLLLLGCIRQTPQETPSIQPANYSGPAVSKNETFVSGIEYKNYEGEGYTILYPEGWGVEDEWIMFISPKENATDSFEEVFTVKTWENNVDLDDLVVDERTYLGELANFTKIERIKFREYEAALLEGDFLPGSEAAVGGGTGNEHFTTIFFKTNKSNTISRLRYTMEKGKEASYMPFVNHMLDTLKIGNDVSKTPEQPSNSSYTYFAGSRFSIEYPSGWRRQKDPSLRFISNKEHENDSVIEDFIIEYWNNNVTFEQLEEEEKRVLYENESFEKVERIDFRGYPAFLFEYVGSQYPESPEKQHYTVIRLKKGEKELRIGYVWESAPNNSKEKYEPIFKKMIESFRFD